MVLPSSINIAYTGPFLYFNIMTLLSVYCNLSLAYLLSMHVHSQLACQMVFAGVVLPLQLLMSGYLVLIRTMPKWVNWGSALCPMYFYMAGVFRNEFYHNSYALGVSSLHFQVLLRRTHHVYTSCLFCSRCCVSISIVVNYSWC